MMSSIKQTPEFSQGFEEQGSTERVQEMWAIEIVGVRWIVMCIVICDLCVETLMLLNH